MNPSLETLLADGVIDAVLGRLKSGKEAEVWLVQRGEEVYAAKVYLERMQRKFRNNAAYLEGRQVRNSRTARAMQKGSRFGLSASEEAWKATEADALFKLHAAGVRVPQPVIFYEGVLVMELVIDATGHPAPRLIDAALTREQAAPCYQDLRGHIVKMLCADVIHGDLSAFNVLLAWNGPTVIDFPQIVSASHNSRAEAFFKRDLENLRRFFEQLDPGLARTRGDAHEVWRAYVRRELTPDFVPREVSSPPPRREFRPNAPARDRGPRRGSGPDVSFRGSVGGGGPPRSPGTQGSSPAAKAPPADGPRGQRRRRRRR